MKKKIIVIIVVVLVILAAIVAASVYNYQETMLSRIDYKNLSAEEIVNKAFEKEDEETLSLIHEAIEKNHVNKIYGIEKKNINGAEIYYFDLPYYELVISISKDDGLYIKTAGVPLYKEGEFTENTLLTDKENKALIENLKNAITNLEPVSVEAMPRPGSVSSGSGAIDISIFDDAKAYTGLRVNNDYITMKGSATVSISRSIETLRFEAEYSTDYVLYDLDITNLISSPYSYSSSGNNYMDMGVINNVPEEYLKANVED